MAEDEQKRCSCTNIAIMQLFHELKQRYPKIPDQIVSKVIEQNFHDKAACETILERESHCYLLSYPGAIISGNAREQLEPLCRHCSVVKTSPPCINAPRNKLKKGTLNEQKCKSVLDGFYFCNKTIGDSSDSELTLCRDSDKNVTSHSEPKDSEKEKLLPYVSNTNVQASREGMTEPKNSEDLICGLKETIISYSNNNNSNNSKHMFTFDESDRDSNNICGALNPPKNFITSSELKDQNEASSDEISVIAVGTFRYDCDSNTKAKNTVRSHTCTGSSSLDEYKSHGIETRRWLVRDGDRKSAVISGIISHSRNSPSPPPPPSPHNYQVAVECIMQPISPDSKTGGSRARSFTSVNLCLRPPSSEPQPPIEIQSGKSLTYSTSSYDPKKGYQSQLQIRIDQGDDGTISACRTYISTPQYRYSSSKSSNSTYLYPASHRCHEKHHLRALLDKQRERRDLLARELRREKEKLRYLQNEVKVMKAAIARRPSPHILPELRNEIVRLRTECERLTAAVDLYSGSRNSLPLGETGEEFYQNIYTGQSFQREDSWSCQMCTFRNHPLLTVCEECGMPRFSLGTPVKDVTSCFPNVFNNNNTSFCSGA